LTHTITTAEFTGWMAFYFDEADAQIRASKEARRR
jgi:hypothetical protein